MQTGVQSFSQLHVNSNPNYIRNYGLQVFKSVYASQKAIYIIHGLSATTFLNEKLSLGLKCRKTQCINIFLAKSVIDPEKTITANCLGLSHSPLNNKKGNKYFLQLKQFPSQNCCIDVFFNRQWACFIFVICFNKWHLSQQTIIIQKHELLYDVQKPVIIKL